MAEQDDSRPVLVSIEQANRILTRWNDILAKFAPAIAQEIEAASEGLYQEDEVPGLFLVCAVGACGPFAIVSNSGNPKADLTHLLIDHDE